jgi:hypothetical protein
VLRRAKPAAPEPPAGVVVGTLAAVDDVVVAPDGSVRHGSGGLRLEWLVGAADEWHRGSTARATARSQRLVDGVPVVETSLRIPGGQVVQRVWAVADGGAEVVVLEVENRSKEAVSVALLVDGVERVAHDGELGLVADGSRVSTGRRAARVVAGVADPVAAVAAGEGTAVAAFDSASGAALVWPLAHTATLRVAVEVDGEWRGAPAALADSDAVVRGWQGHVDAGARVALPDPVLQAASVTARAALLVRAARPHPPLLAAEIADALGRWGHHDAALAPIEHLLDVQRLDGSFDRDEPAATADALAAWAGHVLATGDAVLADRLAEPAAKAAHRLGKLRWKSAPPAWVAVAQRDAAALLDVADQPEAAALCRARVAAEVPAAPASWPDLAAVADDVGGTELGVPARFLRSLRAALVDDRGAGALRLLPAWPDEWLGADLEAHRLPTRCGLLSFAVRWHGARPALLWELDGAATIAAPGLDPAWSSTEPIGEALLEPVEPAGGLPGVVKPLGIEGTPVDEAPDDGAGFG